MKNDLILERLNHFKNTGEIGSSNTAVVVDSKFEIVTVNQVSWIKKIGTEKRHSLEDLMNATE